jgi:O-glycosyl hydrolase
MKNVKLLIHLWLSLVIYPAFATEVDISNKITNPGFESDLTGWTVQNGSDGTNTIVPASATDQKKSGSKSVKFPLNYGNQITTEARVYQTISGLTAGNYILKAYVRGKRWEKDNGIFANGGSGDVKEATDFNSPSNISAQWNLVSVEFTVNNTGSAVIGGYAAKRRIAADRTNDFWIDDFQLFLIEEAGSGNTDCDVTLSQKNLVTRDNNANGFGSDAFTSGGTDNGSNLETDQDNPSKTGINTTNKCLLNKGSGLKWYSYGKISGSTVSVTSTYRYLHVMVKAGITGDSGHEFTNSGDAMLLIRTGSSDNPSDYQGDDKKTDIRIPVTTAWTDIVIDLQARGITEVRGFYFGDQNWTDNHQRELYWDEIVLNNKPCSTNGNTDGGSDNGGEVSILADFESGGVTPSYQDNGGCASNSLAVVNNPNKTCALNTTDKTLYAQTNASNQDWWKGIEIDITDFTVSTSANRYLHILMRTNLPKFEWDIHTSEDNWCGSSTNHAQDNTWFDYVVDLQSVKGTDNLNGKTVTALRIAVSANEEANRSKEIWIDEIVLNNESAVRGVCTTTPINATTITINAATQYQTIEGFAASDCWMGNFVGQWNGNNKATVAKYLFSQKMDNNGSPEGIGLSMWRVNMGAGSYEQGDVAGNIGKDDPNYIMRRAECFLNDAIITGNQTTADVNSAGNYDWSKCAGQQYFMQQAKDYGCESFVAFSNSPLVIHTKNGKAYSAPNSTANIGSGNYTKYADYLANVVKHFKDDGYNFKYISPVNEPQWEWDEAEQEGSPWTNSEIKSLVTALNSSITTKGLTDTKIMITEAGQWDYVYAQSNDDGNQIYQFFDPVSSNYVGNLANVAPLIAGHSYWKDKRNSDIRSVRGNVKSKAEQYNLAVFQTEWSMMEDSGIDGFPSNYNYMDVALNMAKIIHSDLAIANASSWSYWTSMDMERWSQINRFILVRVRPNNSDYPITYAQLKTEGAVTAQPNLWALGNYSLFVRPGYKRIALTGADDLGGLMGTAYLAPDNSKVVAVYVNMATTAKTIKTNIQNWDGSETATGNTYITDLNSNLQKDAAASGIAYNTNNECIIPARSVVTFVYELPRTPFVVSSSKTSSEYLAGLYDDIIFKDGGQLTIDQSNAAGGGLKPYGVVQVLKTFEEKKWYAVGFPFDIVSVHCNATGFDDYDLETYKSGESGSDRGDYWLRTYNGSSDTFNDYTSGAKTLAAGGYVLQVPAALNNAEFTFTSSTGVTLGNFSDFATETGQYVLTSNPSVANLSITPETPSNYYCYEYTGKTGNFGLLSNTYSLKPFESLVVAKNIQGTLRSSLNVEQPTGAIRPEGEQPIAILYYNLQGIAVSQPLKGSIYIAKKIYKNQASEFIKIILK